MSFQEEKREYIKRYMLEKIREDDRDYVKKTAENFGISVTSVKRYIGDCLEKGILCPSAEGATGYSLKKSVYSFTYDISDALNEDIIYFEDIYPLLEDISPEASSIWDYSFMEMMNNAIEHSQGKKIYCTVRKDYLYTEISILDDGIGIFKNVQSFLQDKYRRQVSYQDVLTELYKGKLTTNAKAHSGEGIFFTSRMLDHFAVFSDACILSLGCYNREVFVRSHLIAYYNKLQKIGTMVVMRLDNHTERNIGEVFDMFAPIEEGFVKTRIPVKEVCQLGRPISRSQARRVLLRLEQFKQVELDFDGVEFMGQGFADEVFRVFQEKYPDIELIPINASPTVLGMIKHVQKA